MFSLNMSVRDPIRSDHSENTPAKQEHPQLAEGISERSEHRREGMLLHSHPSCGTISFNCGDHPRELNEHPP